MKRITAICLLAVLGIIIGGIIGTDPVTGLVDPLASWVGAFSLQFINFMEFPVGVFGFNLVDCYNPVEIRQERAKIHKSMQEVLTKAKAEKRELTTEEDTKWNAMNKDLDKYMAKVDQIEAQEKRDAEFAKDIEKSDKKDFTDEQKTELRSQVFRKLITTKGIPNFSEDERKIAEEVRAQATTPGSAGGYLIDSQISKAIEIALLNYGGVYNVSKIRKTKKGGTLNIPTRNSTATKASFVGENTQMTGKDIAYGNIELKAFSLKSNIVKASWEVLQDSEFDMNADIFDDLRDDIGRGMAYYLVKGAGHSSSENYGIETAATASGVSAAASALTRDNIVDLLHSVDIAYRNLPSARFGLNDSTLKAIRKLTIGTSDDRPLWQPGIAAGVPDTIEGYKYFVDNDIDAIGAGLTSMYFGAFEKFIVRIVKEMTLVRLDERYADYGQVGFLMWMRMDSNLKDAGTHPIKKLVHAT